MKPALVILSIFACCLSLGSCTPKKPEVTNDENVAYDSVSSIAPVYMQGMYATSTRLPRAQYGLENMFDNKPETFWSTVVGAGPDEGFVLYFPEKIYVREINLTPASGTGLAVVREVSVYADGQRVGDFDPAKPIAVNVDASAVFIKINSTDKSIEESVSEEEYEGETRSLERFDDTFSVAFSTIRISNAEGEIPLVPPTSVNGAVVASSVLAPAIAYAASQLFDSRKEFVWAEGAKGAGENEKLTFTFEDAQKISSIKVWNGYQRSEKHFESNARVKTFEFGVKNGTKAKYSLEDTMEPQTVKLNEVLEGKELELTVLEVYPGKNYKDLVLSELVFFNNNRPLIIKDNNADEVVKSFLASTKGSVLSSYIDKRLHNKQVYSDYSTDKSLILRSNRTFVIYDHTESSTGATGEEKEVVADGNWEIVEQNADYAKIRIFGKLFNLSEITDYYEGNSSIEYVKIFQDHLLITPTEVKGEKVIDAFYNTLPESL
jgi:hypothetical protein